MLSSSLKQVPKVNARGAVVNGCFKEETQNVVRRGEEFFQKDAEALLLSKLSGVRSWRNEPHSIGIFPDFLVARGIGERILRLPVAAASGQRDAKERKQAEPILQKLS
ncbi:MAG: hypothetical protein C0508_00275 [Cyanobacteria bacterium PR.023]|nr:hypothetical protein [Cyanobacteria bacterium PR.023]